MPRFFVGDFSNHSESFIRWKKQYHAPLPAEAVEIRRDEIVRLCGGSNSVLLSGAQPEPLCSYESSSECGPAPQRERFQESYHLEGSSPNGAQQILSDLFGTLREHQG